MPSATIALDWPPSVNRYWRKWRNRMVISDQGRSYRALVALACRGLRVPRFVGPVSVAITCHPPDRRRRDLDNLLKALLDSLQAAGVMEDDSQVARLLVERGDVTESGSVIVTISGELEGVTA